jgi:hypothetical protein
MKKLFLWTFVLTLLCTWTVVVADQNMGVPTTSSKGLDLDKEAIKALKDKAAQGISGLPYATNVAAAPKAEPQAIPRDEVLEGRYATPLPEKAPYTGPINVPDPNVILQGGDVCEQATVIPGIPYNNTGTTAGYTNDYDEVCNYTGSTAPDVVYSYTPEADICVTITLCVGITDYDTKLYVYEDVCQAPDDGQDPYACNDDDCQSPVYPYNYQSALYELILYAGHTYYIVVDGYGSDYGNYTIDITECVIPTGACCIAEVCAFTGTEAECLDAGGDWYEGETCPEFECPVDPCANAIYDQSTMDYWNSYACDRRRGTDFECWVVDDVEYYEEVQIYDLHWYCVTDEVYVFENMDDWIVLEDAGMFPGAVIVEEWDVPNFRTWTGEYGPWAGRPLYYYTLYVNLALPPGLYWFGMRPINETSSGQNFWMTGPLTGSDVYFRSAYFGFPDWTIGATIFGEAHNVAFCITADMPEPGACCDDETGVCVDDVPADQCPPPLRFASGVLCENLDPPCGYEPTGACCIGEICEFTGTEQECLDAGGDWYEGETCPEFQCPMEDPCVDAIFHNGEPDGRNGTTCERHIGQGWDSWCVDDVQLADAHITDFHWWTIDTGFEWNETDDLLIIEDAGGPFGAVIVEEYDLPNFRYDTGDVLFGFPVYLYSLYVDFNLPAGYYWMGMRPVSDNGGGQSFWATSTANGIEIWFKSDYFGYPDWVPGSTLFGDYYDVAFCITGEMEEVTGACCDDVTGYCEDYVPMDQCPPPLRFAPDVLCENLDPPCEPCPYITVEIMTDDYPGETTWELIHRASGSVVASGGPLSDPNTLHTWQVCADPLDCYDWYIYDAWGDGICCAYGDGYFNIYGFDGELLCTGGEFGDYDVCPDIGTCVPPTGACCIDDICEFTSEEQPCLDAGGDWYEGEECPEFECPIDPCADAIWHNGMPPGYSAYASQCDVVYPFQFACADDFELTEEAPINSIVMWMSFWPDEDIIDPTYWQGATVTIYPDAGGVPGGQPIEGDPDCAVEGAIEFHQYYMPGEYSFVESPMQYVWETTFPVSGLTLGPGLYWVAIEPVMSFAEGYGQCGPTPTDQQWGSLPMLWGPLLGFPDWGTPDTWTNDISFCINSAVGPECEYAVSDVNCNGVPFELADVIAMIAQYRGEVPVCYTCPCPPHGDAFAPNADPNSNCVALELADVVAEIALYRGEIQAGTGCQDCPATARIGSDVVTPSLKSKAKAIQKSVD